MKLNKKLMLLSVLFSLLFTTSFKVYATTNNINLEGSNKKTVYITFDDGPGGNVTKDVLDTLKQEDVPATFFVIGSQIKGQEDIILRMKNEGHSIGLHSYSHDRSKLYCSNDNFLNEMIKSQDILYNVTGEKYNILRFPFGCNNNSYKLTEGLVNELHNKNFKIYDWNVDSGDGANYKSSPENIIKKSCKNDDNVVILMHCSFLNKTSAKALPSIIKYYKDKGYEFKAIDENTPEIYKVMKK
ncbi:polysaccharide deacetylase [Clostridium sp. Sa3CUN1]|uniref:Polysaccharide deacetylase n=1 Tax=Clostridium gallinarum TaxID=2762246 RepID=A0ABR8Q190_9CLOT|nr:polysaccharide deacetylase family protein [Clostridium gallinarum]MBD7914187.1 polysaccharide deacetylase [Clostridium gallinarum]